METGDSLLTSSQTMTAVQADFEVGYKVDKEVEKVVRCLASHTA